MAAGITDRAPDPGALSQLAPAARIDALRYCLQGSFLHNLLEWTAVCLAVLSLYQHTKITSQQNLIADLKAPRQEIRYVISSGQRMGSEAVVLTRNERLSFLINFVPKHEFTSYRAEITGAGLANGYSIPVAASEKDYSVTVSLPAAELSSGEYEVKFWGRTQSGDETKLASGSLEVKLVN